MKKDIEIDAKSSLNHSDMAALSVSTIRLMNYDLTISLYDVMIHVLLCYLQAIFSSEIKNTAHAMLSGTLYANSRDGALFILKEGKSFDVVFS